MPLSVPCSGSFGPPPRVRGTMGGKHRRKHGSFFRIYRNSKWGFSVFRVSGPRAPSRCSERKLRFRYKGKGARGRRTAARFFPPPCVRKSATRAHRKRRAAGCAPLGVYGVAFAARRLQRDCVKHMNFTHVTLSPFFLVSAGREEKGE